MKKKLFMTSLLCLALLLLSACSLRPIRPASPTAQPYTQAEVVITTPVPTPMAVITFCIG